MGWGRGWVTGFLVALVFITIAAGCRRPALATRLGTQEGTQTPSLQAGFAGERALVAWTDAGVCVAAIAPGGAVSPPLRVPDLGVVRAIVPAPDGALLVEGPRYVRMGGDGRLGSVVELREYPPSGYAAAFTLEPDGLAAALVTSDESHTIRYRRYLFDGTPVGPPIEIRGGRFGFELGMVRLKSGAHALAWVDGEDPGRLMISLVDSAGVTATQPRAVYTVSTGGAAHGCSAAASADGNALVTWQDSSPGPWSVYAMKVGADGPLGPATRLSRGRGDATHPTVIFDGQRNRVAWLSGINWGLFAVRDKGKISTVVPGSDKERIYGAHRGLTAYAVAASGKRFLAAGAVREGQSFGIYGAVFRR